MPPSADLFQLVVLALVQGVTEFLPISSSAHLILIPQLTGWSDQGTALDVAVHFGALLAVIVYFRHDAARMAGEALGRAGDGLLLKVAVATVPVVLAGLMLREMVEGILRSGSVIAWATIGFGVLLYVADRSPARHGLVGMPLRNAALIGCAQALALVPGVSRAGITMTVARFLGYSREEAARFALLLSIPAIVAASTLIGWELYSSGERLLQREALVAAGFAFAAALAAISLMMNWLRRASFTPFVVYRLLLGAGLLVWLHA